jgi:hypothetical protein
MLFRTAGLQARSPKNMSERDPSASSGQAARGPEEHEQI